jgi:hypothetical protein
MKNISLSVVHAFSNFQLAKGIDNLNHKFKSLQNYEKKSLSNGFHAISGVEA